MARKPRRWTGSRTPGALKRVRQQLRREVVNRPRRTAAKTYVAKTIRLAASGAVDETREALIAAVSALDRAARNGSIHRNAAARRKSRLMLKINAAFGGESLVPITRPGRTTGRAAAAKAARARVAASKATKAKGEQTAAGKARAALSRTTRGETAPTTAAAAPAASGATLTATKGRAATTATTPTRAATRSRTAGSTRQTGGASPGRAAAATKTTRTASAKSTATTRTTARSASAEKPAKKPAAKTTTRKSR